MHRGIRIQRKRDCDVDRANQKIEPRVLPQARIESAKPEPGEQHESANQHPEFRSPYRAEHRRRDAQKYKCSTPERSEQREARVVGGFHGRILAQAPYDRLAISGRRGGRGPRGPETASKRRAPSAESRP